MNFTWVKNDIACATVTLCETSLTMNTAATNYFGNIRYVLLGYDLQAKAIAIKAVTPKECEQHLYPSDQLYKLSIGKSYGRISSKYFMNEIATQFNLSFGEKGLKCPATYNAQKKMLVVSLEGRQ